jgi:bla regulator protein blaR1
MMRLLAAGMVTVGGSVALSLIAKATVVTALALVAEWLARRRRAAVRHLIMVAAFAVLALLPSATTVIPAIRIPLRFLAMPATGDAVRATPFNRTSEGVMLVAGGPSESRAGSRRTWPAPSTFRLLSTVWLAGVICCLVPVALGLWQIRRVRRHGLPWADGQTMANDLARRAGFCSPIDVIVHEAIVGPITCGVVRPTIVFPLDARTWRDADVRRALTHELEHVRRRDWVTLCLARAICAVYWFHPLVWIANRQLCVNAERACDDAVLRESHAFGYADQLVTLAERSLARTCRPLLAMANRGDLSTRVHAVLDTRQQRGPAGARARIAVTIAAVASVALLAPLRTVAGAFGQRPAGSQVQTSAEPTARPQFDVASIKPSFNDRIMNVRPLPGRLTADATLRVLMQYAYSVQPFQLVGGPSWLTSARYEVDAKADATVNRDQIFLMLQSLLEDRFQLKTHRETKELPVFMLVANKGGVKLPPPKPGVCVDSAADAAVEWVAGRMAAPGELQPAKSRCGSAIVALGVGGAQMLGGKIATSELVRMLSMLLGRSVIDKTGVTALFDLQLDFVPDDTTPTMPPPPPGSGISGVSIAQAIQQQLGLRLEPTKGAVEVIVVDHAERPSAN